MNSLSELRDDIPAGIYTSPSNKVIGNVPGQAAFIKLYNGTHVGNYNCPIFAYNSQIGTAGGGKGLYVFNNTDGTFVKIVSFS